MRVQQEEKEEQQNPGQAAPIKQKTRPQNSLLPGPAAILKPILLNGIEGVLIILGRDEQAPAGAILGEFDRCFNALTYEHQAPVHRLSSRTGGNSAQSRIHLDI